MITKIKNLWHNYGFEIVFVTSILFILVISLYRKIRGYRGTWSKTYSLYNPLILPSGNIANGTTTTHRRGIVTTSKGEAECRRVLQEMFDRPFDKARPDFLRNPVTGGNFNLELDCFNSDLRLAVEYNGIQHYKFIPYMHPNREAFLNQKYRDDMKARMCLDAGVKLIVVPYTVHSEHIRDFLKKELRQAGYPV